MKIEALGLNDKFCHFYLLPFYHGIRLLHLHKKCF